MRKKIHEPTHAKGCAVVRVGSRACDCAAVERAQRDDEAWMHAACLSIAEGVPGWEKPLEHDSLAMITVRALRVRHEEDTQALELMATAFAVLRGRVECLEKNLAHFQEQRVRDARVMAEETKKAYQAVAQAITYRPDPGYTNASGADFMPFGNGRSR